MHELSVTESLLEIALRHGQNANAHRITDLYLVVGQLSSIIDESVQFYWDLVAKDSPAKGATLHFRRVPAEFLCQDCKKHYAPGENDFACPCCGSLRVEVTTGDEFYLESIGVET